MKRGRRWAAAMLAVWMVLALAGCGASTGAAAEATASVSMADSADAAGGYGMSNGTAMPAAVEEAAETDAGEAGDSGTVQERKMIHRAELELETTDFDQAVADLADLTERMGGYYESSTVADRGSDYRWANYTIRVPADQYSAFLDQAGTLCHETWRNTTQDDVSEAYYDVQGRLTTQRVKLERLQALLEQAENMEDIITIESAIRSPLTGSAALCSTTIPWWITPPCISTSMRSTSSPQCSRRLPDLPSGWAMPLPAAGGAF